MKRLVIPSTALRTIALAAAFAAAGCGQDKVQRTPLSGHVTYRGEPVPTGHIVFEPDAVQGNRGPQGYSSIVDGCYETDKYGKGAVTGPINVQIYGFPAATRPDEEVNEPLFPPYRTSVVVSADATSFDFEVPASHGASSAH